MLIAARGSVAEALALLDSRSRVRSDRWFELARRLRGACWSLGSATYCLYEWAEPDDARADIDDYRDPADQQLAGRAAGARSRRGAV
jgi:hypothetical protein